jgi:hypothetical protein
MRPQQDSPVQDSPAQDSQDQDIVPGLNWAELTFNFGLGEPQSKDQSHVTLDFVWTLVWMVLKPKSKVL